MADLCDGSPLRWRTGIAVVYYMTSYLYLIVNIFIVQCAVDVILCKVQMNFLVFNFY